MTNYKDLIAQNKAQLRGSIVSGGVRSQTTPATAPAPAPKNSKYYIYDFNSFLEEKKSQGYIEESPGRYVKRERNVYRDSRGRRKEEYYITGTISYSGNDLQIQEFEDYRTENNRVYTREKKEYQYENGTLTRLKEYSLDNKGNQTDRTVSDFKKGTEKVYTPAKATAPTERTPFENTGSGAGIIIQNVSETGERYNATVYDVSGSTPKKVADLNQGIPANVKINKVEVSQKSLTVRGTSEAPENKAEASAIQNSSKAGEVFVNDLGYSTAYPESYKKNVLLQDQGVYTPRTTAPEETMDIKSPISIGIDYPKYKGSESTFSATRPGDFVGKPGGVPEGVSTLDFAGYKIDQYPEKGSELLVLPIVLGGRTIIGGAKAFKGVYDAGAMLLNPAVPVIEKLKALDPVTNILGAGAETVQKGVNYLENPQVSTLGVLSESVAQRGTEFYIGDQLVKGVSQVPQTLRNIKYDGGIPTAENFALLSKTYRGAVQNRYIFTDIEGNTPFIIADRSLGQRSLTGERIITAIEEKPPAMNPGDLNKNTQFTLPETQSIFTINKKGEITKQAVIENNPKVAPEPSFPETEPKGQIFDSKQTTLPGKTIKIIDLSKNSAGDLEVTYQGEIQGVATTRTANNPFIDSGALPKKVINDKTFSTIETEGSANTKQSFKSRTKIKTEPEITGKDLEPGSTTQKGFTSTFPLTFQYIETAQDQRPIFERAPVIDQAKITDQKSKLVPMTEFRYTQKIESSQDQIQSPRSRTKIGTSEIQILRPLQDQTPAVIQQPRQDIFQETRLTPRTIVPEKPFLPVPIKTGFNESKSQGGIFRTLVKRRGKFENQGSFSDFRSAFNRGESLVRSTASASFKIEGKNPGAVSLGPQLRYSKKNKDVFVEKNRYRINTPGELSQITFKGNMLKKKRKIF